MINKTMIAKSDKSAIAQAVVDPGFGEGGFTFTDYTHHVPPELSHSPL